MNLRVNLLREEELRYQGPVSRRFVIRATASTVGVVVFILLAALIHRQISLYQGMRWARSEWTRLEARYEAVKKMQAELSAHQGLMGELQQWNQTRQSWGTVLESLQAIVPDSVQLTRLTVRTDWEFVRPPAPAPKPAPEGEVAKAEEPPKEPVQLPAQPARRITVNMSGRASGDSADEVVGQFNQMLNRGAGFQNLFQSVKLQRMLKDASHSDEAVYLFEIEAVGQQRKMK